MDVITELQQQRESLKQNIHDMDENIKKLTGRDPAESRRLSATKRIQLKRNSFGAPGDNQPNKRLSTEKRRWGSTAMTRANNLDSGGEEQEEKKPAVQSSVVVTGKPIEPLNTISEDSATKKRNKRMFGLLMGTLKQFKRESQVKTEQEARREEKLIKVEIQVQKDKDDAVVERRELFQTRRGKQQELRNLEFKIEMAELNEELKSHYEQIKDFIQLKSTPRIFYKPAEHNEKTTKLLKESQEGFKESLHQRLKEIAMCTEDDMSSNTRTLFRRNRQFVGGKSAKDPIIIDQAPSKRDLFAEDADNDQQERVEVLVEDTVEPVIVADEESVEELPVVLVEPMKDSLTIVEEINSKINGNDKELRDVMECSDKHVLGPHLPGLDKDVQRHGDEHVYVHDDVDEHVRGHGGIDEHADGSGDVDEHVQGKGDVDEHVHGKGDVDEHVRGHGEIDEHVDGCGDIDEHVDKNTDVEEHVQVLGGDIDRHVQELTDMGEHVQRCGEVYGHIQGSGVLDEHVQGQSNLDEQVEKSSIVNNNVLAVTNDDLFTKTDDSFLHDEYAAQLLEQVVDEGRVVSVSSNSYDVVDERLVNISSETQILHDTKDYIDGKTESDLIPTVITDTNTTEDEPQKGIELGCKEDP